MRYLSAVMDISGVVILVGGLCLLASLAHLYLVPVAAGASLIGVGALVDMRARKRSGQ